MTEIKLPALKENVEVVEVNQVLVKPGDQVARDQPLLEVQADKAALDVPSPAAGRVAEMRVKPGDQVKIGQVYCVLDANSAGAPARESKPAAPDKRPATPEARRDEPRPEEKPKPEQVPVVQRKDEPQPATAPAPRAEGVVPAGPATRRLARELGVDLVQVSGTGRNGRVTQDDVKAFIKRLASGSTPVPAAGAAGVVAPPLPNFENVGPVERQPLTNIRKATANQMSLAWSLIPHVTQHDEADITDLDAFRRSRDGKGPKLTVTAFVLKACAVALRQFPAFNATLDLANSQLILKRYYHIGVAVDTDRGLLVPVIRDVDKKSVEQLAAELNETAEKARQGRADMTGGSFTVTNLGGIGGTAFTPIVNWPEVAILGLSRSRLTPVIRDGAVTPRLMMPLSLSYDHRVIDGAAAARFTRFIAEVLENPWMLALKS